MMRAAAGKARMTNHAVDLAPDLTTLGDPDGDYDGVVVNARSPGRSQSLA
jgi:hypothetical protein